MSLYCHMPLWRSGNEPDRGQEDWGSNPLMDINEDEEEDDRGRHISGTSRRILLKLGMQLAKTSIFLYARYGMDTDDEDDDMIFTAHGLLTEEVMMRL